MKTIKYLILFTIFFTLTGCSALKGSKPHEEVTGTVLRSSAVAEICFVDLFESPPKYYYHGLHNNNVFNSHHIQNGAHVRCILNPYKTRVKIKNPNNNRGEVIDVVTSRRYHKDEEILILYQ